MFNSGSTKRWCCCWLGETSVAVYRQIAARPTLFGAPGQIVETSKHGQYAIDKAQMAGHDQCLHGAARPSGQAWPVHSSESAAQPFAAWLVDGAVRLGVSACTLQSGGVDSRVGSNHLYWSVAAAAHPSIDGWSRRSTERRQSIALLVQLAQPGAASAAPCAMAVPKRGRP